MQLLLVSVVAPEVYLQIRLDHFTTMSSYMNSLSDDDDGWSDVFRLIMRNLLRKKQLSLNLEPETSNDDDDAVSTSELTTGELKTILQCMAIERFLEITAADVSDDTPQRRQTGKPRKIYISP